MRNRYAKLALFALPLAAFTAFSGCHGCHSPESRSEHAVNYVARKLDLDDGQKARLETIRKQWLADRAEMKKDRAAAIETLIAQARADKLDQAKLQGLVDSKLDQIGKKSPKYVELIAEFHASLKPEQKAKLAEHLEKFREKLLEE